MPSQRLGLQATYGSRRDALWRTMGWRGDKRAS